MMGRARGGTEHRLARDIFHLFFGGGGGDGIQFGISRSGFSVSGRGVGGFGIGGVGIRFGFSFGISSSDV